MALEARNLEWASHDARAQRPAVRALTVEYHPATPIEEAVRYASLGLLEVPADQVQGYSERLLAHARAPLEAEIDNAHFDGHEAGYDEGHDDGYRLGFDSGFNQGYSAGEKDERKKTPTTE